MWCGSPLFSLDLSPGWNLFILFGQNQPQHALYQRFPTHIRALPVPSGGGQFKIQLVWAVTTLIQLDCAKNRQIDLIDSIVRQALLNLSGHNHFWKLRRITLWKPVFELLLPISEGLGSNRSQLPRNQWMNLDLVFPSKSFWKIPMWKEKALPDDFWLFSNSSTNAFLIFVNHSRSLNQNYACLKTQCKKWAAKSLHCTL